MKASSSSKLKGPKTWGLVGGFPVGKEFKALTFWAGWIGTGVVTCVDNMSMSRS